MTNGEGATSYGYNNFRQLQTETRTFTGLANRSYKLSYTYDYAYNAVGAPGGVGTNLIGSDPTATINHRSTLPMRDISLIVSAPTSTQL